MATPAIAAADRRPRLVCVVLMIAGLRLHDSIVRGCGGLSPRLKTKSAALGALGLGRDMPALSRGPASPLLSHPPQPQAFTQHYSAELHRGQSSRSEMTCPYYTGPVASLVARASHAHACLMHVSSWPLQHDSIPNKLQIEGSERALLRALSSARSEAQSREQCPRLRPQRTSATRTHKLGHLPLSVRGTVSFARRAGRATALRRYRCPD